MNPNLAAALNWIGIKKETAPLFFDYLQKAGYLDEGLIQKAIQYLHTEKTFDGFESSSADNIAKLLIDACKQDTETFLATFASQLNPVDILDLILFLQQTAFDRAYGQERNQLTEKPWMGIEANQDNFMRLQQSIGLVEEQLPKRQHYDVIGIMGASYPRAISRIAYFKALMADFDAVFAITGQRYLSKGLDGEETISNMAKKLSLELDCITETQMLMELINTECPAEAEKMHVIDSTPGEWHWRADTTQNAKDFAWTMSQRIRESATRPVDGKYAILLIVEQPYSNRMAKQVQRALNEVAEQYNEAAQDAICFVVEASGKELPSMETLDEAARISRMTQCNSDLAAWIGECYKDARTSIQQHYPKLRAPECLMYNSRDAYFQKSVTFIPPSKDSKAEVLPETVVNDLSQLKPPTNTLNKMKK